MKYDQESKNFELNNLFKLMAVQAFEHENRTDGLKLYCSGYYSFVTMAAL